MRPPFADTRDDATPLRATDAMRYDTTDAAASRQLFCLRHFFTPIRCCLYADAAGFQLTPAIRRLLMIFDAAGCRHAIDTVSMADKALCQRTAVIAARRQPLLIR